MFVRLQSAALQTSATVSRKKEEVLVAGQGSRSPRSSLQLWTYVTCNRMQGYVGMRPPTPRPFLDSQTTARFRGHSNSYAGFFQRKPTAVSQVQVSDVQQVLSHQAEMCLMLQTNVFGQENVEHTRGLFPARGTALKFRHASAWRPVLVWRLCSGIRTEPARILASTTVGTVPWTTRTFPSSVTPIRLFFECCKQSGATDGAVLTGS